MKSMFICWIVVFLFAAFLNGQEGAQDGTQEEKGTGVEKQGTEQEVSARDGQPQKGDPEEEGPEQVFQSEIESFYKDPGLGLFPKTRKFSVRNVLKNSFSYDSNVYLVPEDEEDDVLYTLDFTTEWLYKSSRLSVELMGGISYEHYFEEKEADEVMPRASLKVDYQAKGWNFRLQDTFSRGSVLNTGERNGRVSWHSNSLTASAGVDYKQWLMEVSLSHAYTDLRNIRGDFETYGASFMIGYNATPRLALTLDYGVHTIRYHEGYYLARKRRVQEETLEHTIHAGARFQFTRSLMGSAMLGVGIREEKAFPNGRADVTWYPSTRMNVRLEFFTGTVPSFLDDYQRFASGKVSWNYLFLPRLMGRVSLGLMYGDSTLAEPYLQYNGSVGITYRIRKGWDAEVDYQASFMRSDNDAGDYEKHRVTGGISVTF